MTKLEGVFTALVTPFDAEGEVDLKAMERLLEDQLKHGAAGFIPCGTTGEYYAMTTEERRRVLKFVAEWTGDKVELVAGANGSSTHEVIEHCRAARSLGYSSVLLGAPNSSHPAQQELIEHYKAILAAVDVNIVLYDLPSHAGVEVGFEVLDAFAKEGRVIGIKESSGNVMRAAEIVRRYGADYHLLSGADYLALDLFQWGARGWVCGSANCFPRQTNAIMRAALAGDYARAKAEAIAVAPGMACLEASKFMQKAKYGCELHGVPVGLARRPHLALTDAEKAEFRRAFEESSGTRARPAA